MGDESLGEPHLIDRLPDYDGMPIAALRRYIIGQSDVAERQRVDAWAAASVERRRYLAGMQHLFGRAPAAAANETAAAWTRLAHKLSPPAPSAPPNPPYVAPWEEEAIRVDVRRRRPRVLSGAFSRAHRPYASALAAAAGVVAIAGAIALQHHAAGPAPRPAARAMRLIATAKGQRAEIRLADGSRVVLGVDSRLRFASDFGELGAEERDLYLDGTAYFDVVHDSAQPLRIHTSNALTEDVGTRFVVTAYSESRSTRVVVEAGAVALRAARAGAAGVELTAGHMGRLEALEDAPLVRTVDTASYTAWMQGRLVFRDAPLSDVVSELRRWYDVDVRIGDRSLAQMPLSASFTAESFRQALLVVTTVLPVRTVRRGSIVTLYHR